MAISEQQLIDLLISNNILKPNDVQRLTARQSSSGNKSATSLEHYVREGRLSRESIKPFIKDRLKLLSLSELSPDHEALKKVPFKYASFYSFLPLKIEDSTLHCAMSNPFDNSLREEIETVLDISIEPAWVFYEDIQEAHKRYYGLGANIENDQKKTELNGKSASKQIELDNSSVKLIDEILLDAQLKRATDIHVEPHEKRIRLRYRIDGMLYDQNLMDSYADQHDSIIARLKVLANLDLADKRRPQDGRIMTKIENNEFDLRISILPTEFGETVDIRLLNNFQINQPPEKLGFSESDLEIINKVLNKQNGIILVTGPTGSGKTTTLYSFLQKLKTPDRKIITIEDPIEYQLENITQLQVHPQINFTFANGLRSMLRHDPDIMMVGEIRDSETAKIAIQVALTGHLVLSTIHTNDSVSSLSRLFDMGIEKYLCTATLECIIAQRLVRKICPHCKTESKFKLPEVDFPTFEGEGCSYCNNSGFYGRTAVFEIFQIDEEIRELISAGISNSRIKEKALIKGMKTLYMKGLEKAKSGITSLSEVMRVIQTEV
jgi:type II secretory ATPase GspE/PulE/Tfp pilus assembly ATPase PilB-like protein